MKSQNNVYQMIEMTEKHWRLSIQKKIICIKLKFPMALR